MTPFGLFADFEGINNMATIKTRELSGVALDYAVAQCEGEPLAPQYWHYSTDWGKAGPIIERESISLERQIKMQGCRVVGFYDWWAVHPKNYGGLIRYFSGGPTPLVAAMRCFVASKMGDNVEIPDFLAPLVVKE